VSLDVEEEIRGEIVELAKALLNYAQGKGQIHSATDMALLYTYSTILDRLGAKGVAEALAGLATRMIDLSVHEPRYYQTVWQYVIEKLSQGLVSRIEVVESKRKLTKVGYLGA